MVVSNIFYFHPCLFGEMIKFDYCFSDGLVQPPTRNDHKNCLSLRFSLLGLDFDHVSYVHRFVCFCMFCFWDCCRVGGVAILKICVRHFEHL